MTRYLCLASLVTVLPLSEACAQTALDKARQRLAALVQPGARFDAFGPVSGPLARGAVAAVEQPPLQPPPYQGLPPAPTSPPGKISAPPPPREEAPLLAFREEPKPPVRVQLPTGPLLRLPSAEVQKPLPLPILAQPLVDRASLADPTLEASVAAALRPLVLSRKEPLAFAAINLPDPFENEAAGRLRNPPEESASGPIIPLRTPAR